MNLKKEFISQVSGEIKRFSPHLQHVALAGIGDLPEAVQRHFLYCGFTNIADITNARIYWDALSLKNNPGSKAMTVKCHQFNSVPVPVRIAYMKSIHGIGMEGKDEYYNDHGRMQIRLLKFINVVNAAGIEMDRSALVTLLAEALLVPSYALQSYIKWETVDEFISKATLRYNGLQVSGTFHFAENGACIKFKTNDRFMQRKNIAYNCPWEARFEKYKLINTILTPSVLRAVWRTSEGDFEYAAGTLAGIDYNVSSIDL